MLVLPEYAPLLAAALAGWVITLLGLGFWTNRDLLSPAKFLVLTTGFAFGSLAWTRYPLEVYGLLACLLLIGTVVVLAEAGSAEPSGPRPRHRPSIPAGSMRRAVRLLWAVTLLPIAAQLFAIRYFGGFAGYVAMIGLRVISWQGLGPVRVAINLIAVINLLYFGVLLLSERRPSPAEYALFGVHLALVVLFGLMSASRGATVLPILALVVSYNVLRRPITVRAAFVLLLLGLGTVMALGVARSGYRWSRQGLETGFSQRGASVLQGSAIFSYGSAPAELAMTIAPARLQYGMTYVAAFTNFVPRRIWPDKPATGGVVMTREYLGDRWRGLSNITPGIFGEAILNFGAAGLLFAPLLLLGTQLAMLRLYRVLSASETSIGARRMLILTGCYAIVLPLAAGLVYMEFGNAVLTVVTRTVPLAFLGLVVVRPQNRAAA